LLSASGWLWRGSESQAKLRRRSIKLYHRQVYAYAYHRSKLTLLRCNPQHRRFEALATFLENIPSTCPHDLFRREDDPKARASQARPAFANADRIVINRKENTATGTAALIIPAVGANKLRHETAAATSNPNHSKGGWCILPELACLCTVAGGARRRRGDRPSSALAHALAKAKSKPFSECSFRSGAPWCKATAGPPSSE